MWPPSVPMYKHSLAMDKQQTDIFFNRPSSVQALTSSSIDFWPYGLLISQRWSVFCSPSSQTLIMRPYENIPIKRTHILFNNFLQKDYWTNSKRPLIKLELMNLFPICDPRKKYFGCMSLRDNSFLHDPWNSL